MSDLATMLAQHPFCAGLSPHHIGILADCAGAVHFAPGEVLARQGSPADATFLIRSGRVALRSGRETVETIDADEILGWSWLLEGTTWHVDAVAQTAVSALRLDGAELDAQMHAQPAFGHALARHILAAVHTRLERARLRSLDVFGSPT